jgi:O-acetyl-ADP-ribose deacetylase (regulator of RNase III)
MVDAWRLHFRNVENVEVGYGDIFEAPATAIVSPANSFGFMNGGIDLAYSKRFGWGLQDRLQRHLHLHHDGELPVGQAALIPIEKEGESYKYLISAPTMRVPTDISGTVNAYLAMRAVLRLVQSYNLNAIFEAKTESIRAENHIKPDLIDSVICPGLGTNIGRLPYGTAAYQMREAYRIVMENQPLSFQDIGGTYSYHEAMRRGMFYKEPESLFGES